MMRVSGAPYEFEEQHRLAIKLVDPERDEQEILSAGFGPIPAPPPDVNLGLDVGILVPAAIGWTAEHFGLYTLEILIDDRSKKSIAIVVRDATEPGGQT